ncbi:ceramide kinase family protein isoform X2 [Polyodon spathula]|uniref:ceramide kinase family protein isoform X2 n=1 Tax=Polyodon spathula TaxID=7913 RepID=UPI001B7DDA82|nr:ceramide kinase family protein isoform X2 [Polyodon spathula]
MESFSSTLKIGKKNYTGLLSRRLFKWTGLTHRNEENAVCVERVPVEEIVGVQAGRLELLPEKRVEESETEFTVLYVRRVHGGQRWSLGQTVFTAPDLELRDRWVQSLRHCTEKYSQDRPRNLLVFINPFGGRQRGREVYHTQIAPLFELAGVRTHVLETERANHARDYILKKDLTGFDGLVCVGGDGMFSELMHGLIGRTQWEAGISEHDPEATLESSSLRIGIIPAGSTDCVCFATVGVNDPITSALHIIIGDSQPLDVCSVHHRKRLLKYSVSLVGYGFYGDVLADSDRNRWMGPIRYDYSGLKMFLSNRSYKGTVRFQLAESQSSNPRDNTRCRTGCMVCSESTERLCSLVDSSFDSLSRASLISSCSASLPGDWRSVSGSFKAVNLTCMSSACPKSPGGLSPSAHLADGTADLILVRDCGRAEFLEHLRRHTNNKDQFDLPFVEVYRVTALHFFPENEEEDENEGMETEEGTEGSQHKTSSFLSGICGVPPSRSKWNCDGELVPHAAIHARVHCQLIRLFARGIESSQGKRRGSRLMYYK